MSKRHVSSDCARRTSNKGELLLEDLFKLPFRDTISVEDNAFRGLIGLLLLEIGSVVDEFRDHVLWDTKSVKCRDGGNSAGSGTLVIRFKSSTISTRPS